MVSDLYNLMQSAPDIDYKHLYDESQVRILSLEQQLKQLQKMIFASRHERYVSTDANPTQLSLDITAEPATSSELSAAKKISYTKPGTTSASVSHPGRM